MIGSRPERFRLGSGRCREDEETKETRKKTRVAPYVHGHVWFYQRDGVYSLF